MLLCLTVCDFMVYKDYKISLKNLLSNTWNQLQDPTPHLFSYLSSCHHPSWYFFGDRTKRVSLTYHPSAFDHKLFFDDFRSSSVHVIQKGISALKIISFYLVMVSLMAFSSSFFVFIQSRRGMFNSFAFSNNDVLFIYYYFVTLG